VLLWIFRERALITFLPALLLSFMGNLGLANTTFGDSDFAGLVF